MVLLFYSLGIAIFFDVLKTLRVYCPTLISKGVIAIFQIWFALTVNIHRHHHTNASPQVFVVSRQIRTNQSQLVLLQQTRAHSYAHPRQLCDLDFRSFKV